MHGLSAVMRNDVPDFSGHLHEITGFKWCQRHVAIQSSTRGLFYGLGFGTNGLGRKSLSSTTSLATRNATTRIALRLLH